MCGVFGFIADKDHYPDMAALERMAVVTERRGPHAFGFAWITQDNRLQYYKQPGRISDSLEMLELIADAKMAICHTRYATEGDPDNNLNNHPHPCDGGWIVHNGCIRDWQDAIRLNGLCPVTQCDSEVLGLLIERAEGTLIDRTVESVRSLDKNPLVMLGLWTRPNRMIVVRQGNPLSFGKTKHVTYLASYGEGMPGDVRQVMNDTARQFSDKGIIYADIYPHATGNTRQETLY